MNSLIPDFLKPSKYLLKHNFSQDAIQDGKFTDGKPAYEGLRVYIPKLGDYLAKNVKEILGGKGAGLAEMINMRLPVPPAAIIPTSECVNYFNSEMKMDASLCEHVKAAIEEIERITGKKFGVDLTLSVRSGAKISMPGMMETILNLGMNDGIVEKLISEGKDEHYVYDKYRRFLQYFGSVVLEAGIFEQNGEKISKYEEALKAARESEGVRSDPELSVQALKGLIKEFKGIIADSGKEIPQDPLDQVMAAVEAVFHSSYADKAMKYKMENKLPLDMPTAVNIQAMVDGNLNSKSGSGVLFTRDKNTGENNIYSNYLANAQGEEVVSGVRTATFWQGINDCPFDKRLGEQLLKIAKQLEKHYRDMVDIEYTIENGKLYILQVRTGKRSGKAAFQIACDLMDQKGWKITPKEAVKCITMDNILSALLPQIDPEELKNRKADAKGVAASAGAGCGMAVFSAKKAAKIFEDAKAAGKKPPAMLLVKNFTNTEDYEGMVAAGKSGGGVLTAVGGPTSHAAVVCGGNGIAAVVGCGALHVDQKTGKVTLNGKEIKEGDYLTIDGTTGEVYVGKLKLVPPELTCEFTRMINLAKGYSTLPVHANADKPEEARLAVELGAEGIGLCRTEHMFEKKERIGIVRKMFLSKTDEERQSYLNLLKPMQQDDFLGIFNAMTGKPVTIRLLDPPMHEFLPDHVKLERQQAGRQMLEFLAKSFSVDIGFNDEMVKRMFHAGDYKGILREFDTHKKRLAGIDPAADAFLDSVGKLHESNPMLSERGVRLLQRFPEILDMQVEAIINAALDSRGQGNDPHVKIMVPVVNDAKEFAWARERIDAVAKDVFTKRGQTMDYKVGTMIEIPSACLQAGEIAKIADFFSFGTNDLTQTGLGLSRDDTAAMIARYIKDGLLESDPFRTLHPAIAELIDIAVKRGREANPNLEIGICGEQGVDPVSLRRYLNKAGLNSVSGTPMRGPLAIFTNAQIALEEEYALAA
jgi:pyruvate,orthophosphate dikinase